MTMPTQEVKTRSTQSACVIQSSTLAYLRVLTINCFPKLTHLSIDLEMNQVFMVGKCVVYA